MGATNVGAEAKVRGSNQGWGYTRMSLANPATAAFSLSQVEFYFVTNASGICIGSLYLVSGTTYQCRDAAAIGNVPGGSKQTITGLKVSFQAGDYLAYYNTGGIIYADAGGSGYYGFWDGINYCVAGRQGVGSLSPNGPLSLYGSGSALGQPYISRVQGIPGMRSFSMGGHGAM